MSKYSQTVEYNLRTTLDNTGLLQLQHQLSLVRAEMNKMVKEGDINSEFAQAAKNVEKLQLALRKSFNSNIGIFDLRKFQQELNGLSLSRLQKDMNSIGTNGTKAFNNMIGSIGRIDTSFKSISSLTDKIYNTMGNTVRWGITASIFQRIQNSLYSAVEYVKELDTSLNNIRIVTGASNSDMRDFALYANESAQAIGSSTTAFTNAAQLYAQNGFNEADYTRLAEITTKVANVTQQNTEDVSEQITALMEGYHMSIDQVEDALGGMAVVAAASAADLEELATAEQKVASTANTLGVSHEQLTAQIGTIVSVTRQAPESVGNAMRTLYARIADLKMGETLEDGTTLGNLSGQLEDLGIEVIDQSGNLRNLGDILEDLQAKWGDLSNAQQIALGTKLAGKYQLNPFMALMENADMYQEQLNMMQTSQGALDEQQAIYMDSLAAKIQTLVTAGEGLVTHLFNADDIKPFIEALTDVVNLLTQFTDAVGGAGPMLASFGAVATNVFSKQIAGGINNIMENRIKRQTQRSNEEILIGAGANNSILRDIEGSASGTFLQETAPYRGILTGDQQKRYNETLDQLVEIDNRTVDTMQQAEQLQLAYQKVLREELPKLAEAGIKVDMDNLAIVDEQFSPESGGFESFLQERDNAIKAYNVLNDDVPQFDALVQNGKVSSEIYNNMEEGFNKSAATLKTLVTTYDDDNKALLESMKESYAGIGEALKKGDSDAAIAEVRKLQNATDELKKSTQEAITARNELDRKTGGSIDRIQQAEAMSRNAQEEASILQAEREQAKADAATRARSMYIQEQIGNVTALAGAIGQLTMGFMTLSQIPMIWDDEDLTNSEKLTQTIMLLAMDLPMIISSIQPAVEGFKSVGNLIKELAAHVITKTAATVADTAATATNAAVTETASVATTANAAATTAYSGAATVATGATLSLSAALKTLLPFIGIFAGIAAGVGALAALGKMAWDGWNEAEIKATEARDRANEVAQAAHNVSSAYEEMQTNISSYNSAIDSLNELEEGTNEWKQALIDVNEQVLQLLELYPQLAQYVSSDNGQLRISQEGLDALLEEQSQAVAEAQLASAQADLAATEAEARANRVDLGRRITWSDDEATKAYDENGNYTGVSVVRQGSVTESQMNTIMDLIDRQGLGILSDPQALADALGVDVADPIVEAIQGAKDDIASAYNEEATNRLAAETSMEAAVQNLLIGQEGYDSSSAENDALVSYIARQSSQGGALYEAAYSDVEGLSKEEVAEQLQDSFNAADYTIDGDKITFKDEEGNEIDSIEYDAAQEMLAAMNAASEAADNWREIAGMINLINTSDFAKNTGMDISGALDELGSGGHIDFNDFSKSDYENIAAELYDENGNLVSDSDLQDLLFQGMSDTEANEAAAQYGFENAQAAVKAFKDEMSAGLEDYNAFQDMINGTGEDSITYETIEDDDWDPLKFRDQSQEILNNVDNITDLDTAYSSGTMNVEDYREGLEKLGQEYSDLRDLSSELARAQDKYDDTLREHGKESEEAKEAEEDLLSVQEDLQKELVRREWGKAAEEVANYVKTLNEAEKGSEDYENAAEKVADKLSDLTNLDVDSSFVSENMDLINDWVNGVEGAGSKLRVKLGQELSNYSQYANQLANATGVNATAITNALDALDFNIDGTADFTNLFTQMGLLNDNFVVTQENARILADYLASVGNTTLTFRGQNEGEILTVDTAGLQSDNPITQALAMAKLQYGIAKMRMGWTVDGDVPAMGNPVMTNAGSGGGYSGGGGSGGGGGGSGGGSGTKYEPQEKDPVEDELDRYERVNAELDTLANNLDIIAEEQDRLVGDDMAKNMAQQIDNLKQQVYWQNEKLKIQRQEAAEYRDELGRDYGIRFDEEGHITNYAEKYKQLLNNLNGLIDQYNKTTTESGQEALEKRIEAAQEEFDNYNDLIEKYDELVSNSIIESEGQIEDFYNQIEDLQIEAFQTAVEAVDNLKDLQETIIDFNAVFSGLDSDSPYRDMMTAFQNLKTYWDIGKDSMEDYYDKLIAKNKEAMKYADAQEKKNLEYQNALLEYARGQYGQGTFEEGGTGLFDMMFGNVNAMLEQMRQFNETGTSSIFGENSGSMYEVAQDIFDSATDLLSEYEGHLDDLKDAILDAIDEIGEKMDERLETYENINDELDHYASIIELVQGDQAYDSLNETLSASIANNEATIKELQANLSVLIDLRDAMEEGSDEWKAVNEIITDQQNQLLETTEDTLDKMVEMYENSMNQILDKWIGSTGMGDDLDWIAEEWELINRNADYYLDDVNAAYEIQKLQSKYLDLLDDANGLDIQNQITQQMAQQLGYLREKEKLSEYDVQYANAQLEILQRQIALQEAQRNKSQLQLRRDNQGNYSYVYTADEDEVRNAEGDLLDAQNNAYNLSKEQMKQTQDDSLNALQDARDTLEQIWTNANLTLEEKTKRTQTVIDSLKEYLAGTSEQLSESEKNIINDFIGMCDILTDENDQRLQDVYEQIIAGNNDAFDQIDTRWQTSITNWLQNLEDFNASTDSAFGELVDNFEGYQTSTDELGDLVGMTFDDMSDTIQNAVDKTNDLASSTADFINQLKNDAGTVKEYENNLAEMTAKIQDAENGMRAYQEQVNKLQQDLTAQQQENANLTQQVANLQNQLDAERGYGSGTGAGGSGSGGTAGKGDSATAWGVAQAIWTYGQASGWGNDPIRSTKLAKTYGQDFAKQVQDIINKNSRSGKLVNYDSMKYSSYNLIGYRSGGYTGEWNDTDGKLGVLHQKELILNQTDTENILNAVDMVRSLTAMARDGAYSNVINQSNGLIDMASVINNLPDDFGGTTTYQVECTFPNATNVDEIQRAILTLPDIAPQYAYKY